MSIDAIEPFPGQELTAAIRAAVTVEERFVPGPPDSPEVRVLLYRQKGVDSTPSVDRQPSRGRIRLARRPLPGGPCPAGHARRTRRGSRLPDRSRAPVP